MADEFADIDKALFSGEQKPPSAKEAAELQAGQQEQDLIKQQADQAADRISADSEFADIDRVLFKEGLDPITGNQRAFHANGVSPEKAINESPLTAGQRLKLSFSDEKGKIKFLQGRDV